MERVAIQFVHMLKYSDYINSQSDVNTDILNFKHIIAAYPNVINDIFDEYNTFIKSIENVFHLIRYYPHQLSFDMDKIKKVLAYEHDACILDACLQMLETYSIDFDADISFVRDYKYPYKWLIEYANSISEQK